MIITTNKHAGKVLPPDELRDDFYFCVSHLSKVLKRWYEYWVSITAPLHPEVIFGSVAELQTGHGCLLIYRATGSAASQLKVRQRRRSSTGTPKKIIIINVSLFSSSVWFSTWPGARHRVSASIGSLFKLVFPCLLSGTDSKRRTQEDGGTGFPRRLQSVKIKEINY